MVTKRKASSCSQTEPCFSGHLACDLATVLSFLYHLAFQNIQTDLGAHATSYSVGARALFGGTAAEA